MTRQKGFGLVSGLLVVLAVAAVAGAGVYVHQRSTRKNIPVSAAQPAAKPAQAQRTSQTERAVAKKHGAQEAVSYVQKTYDDYLIALKKANDDKTAAYENGTMDPNDTRGVAQIALTSVKDRVAPDLFERAIAIRSAAPFSCTAQFVTDKYAASLASNTDTTATVAVAISNGGGMYTNGMTASVDLSTLKITDITCPT